MHPLQVFVGPCQEASLNCELEVELELFAAAKRVVRTLKIPVHRLFQERDQT